MKKIVTIFYILILSSLIFSQDMELIGVRGGSIEWGDDIAKTGNRLYIGSPIRLTNDTSIIKIIPQSGYSYISSQVDTNLLIIGYNYNTSKMTIDGGDTWKEMQGASFLINPLNPNTLFCIREEKEIWKSFDKGNSWIKMAGFNKVNLLEMAPADTNYIYCNADNSIYQSTNGGVNWKKKYNNNKLSIDLLKINPQNKNSIYFGSYLYLYKTYMDDTTFTPMRLTDSVYMYSLKLNYLDTNNLYYSTYEGDLYRTNDGAVTWKKLSFSCRNLLIDPKNPSILYGMNYTGVQKSIDGGDTWFETNLSYSGGEINFISKDTLIVVTDKRLFKSTNQGKSWYVTNVARDNYTSFSNLVFSRHQPNIGILGQNSNENVMRTTDYGETWNDYGISERNNFVKENPHTPGVFYIIAADDYMMGYSIYTSTDYGVTFNEGPDSNAISYFVEKDSSLRYIIGKNLIGLYRTTDKGLTWKMLLEDRVYMCGLSDTSIIVEYQDTIRISYDKGETWEPIFMELLKTEITSLAKIWIDPKISNRYYIPTYKGLYLSDGKNWKKIFNIDGDLYKENNSGFMYISTNHGIYRFYDTLTITSVTENKLSGVPENYYLSQNYPNPFNPVTTFKYSLPLSGNVSIKLYDILGKEITTLINEYKSAGSYEIKYDASNLSSGIYLYRINSGQYSETKKMVLMK